MWLQTKRNQTKPKLKLNEFEAKIEPNPNLTHLLHKNSFNRLDIDVASWNSRSANICGCVEFLNFIAYAIYLLRVSVIYVWWFWLSTMISNIFALIFFWPSEWNKKLLSTQSFEFFSFYHIVALCAERPQQIAALLMAHKCRGHFNCKYLNELLVEKYSLWKFEDFI